MSLAINVRHRRETVGLTQKALAEAVGVSQPAIAQIESGATRNPTTVVLRKLATVLEVSVDYLLAEPEEEAADAATEPA